MYNRAKIIIAPHVGVDRGTESHVYGVQHERITSLYDLGPRGLVNAKNPARQVGSLRKDGYRFVMVDGERIYEHILVYFYHYGTWPEYRLSHFDGDRSNNSIKNIIEEGEHYIRLSKYFGVRYDPSLDKWVTRVIGKHFNNYFLGPFDTEVEAAKAYDTEQRKMFGPKAIFCNFPRERKK